MTPSTRPHHRPVAEARVFHIAGRQRVEATTDKDGGFRLHIALSSPGFVFVEKAGFRFHGQRCDTSEERKITLLRRDERVPKPMTSLLRAKQSLQVKAPTRP